MSISPLGQGQLFLDGSFPLPLDQPFTPAQAADVGVSRQRLRRLLEVGQVRRVLRGVYAVAQAPDDLELRCAALGLVVPRDSVIVDRTAAWLHGVEILPRTAREVPPPIEVYRARGDRLRRTDAATGKRGLRSRDLARVEGLVVTTPLRTTCDLGRLLWRFDAMAALDAFRRAGVSEHRLLAEVERFRGYRGVRQLRAFAPLASPLAESPPESALRLAWYDACLPPPTLQHWVEDDAGVAAYRLDLALPEVRYAAEYDGADYHSSPAQRRHDDERRGWLTMRGWHIDVFTKRDVYGSSADASTRLRRGFNAARRGVSLWTLARRRTTTATSPSYGRPQAPPRRG